MAGSATTRASDADRDRVAGALREHLAAGRLTIEEFDERLDRAFAAKTLGELEQVMADLPAAGRADAGALDHRCARPQRTPAVPAATASQAPRRLRQAIAA